MNRIGEKFITNEGLVCEIVEYVNIHNCTVRFENGKLQRVQYHHLKKGRIKHPYYRSVYGIGYLGEGLYKPSTKSLKSSIYNTWHSLIQRCYDPIKLQKHPSYSGCTVCEEWQCFQTFADFYVKNNPYDF
jgi:hypothetical protein